MPTQILFLIESLGPGGAEASLCTYLKFLDRDRFRGIVCPLYASQSYWRKAIEDASYRVVSPGLRGRWDWKRGLFGLRDMFRSEKIDLIHSQLYDANLYGRFLGRSLSIPVLASLQSSHYEPEAWRWDERQSRLKLNLFRLLDQYTGHRWGTRWIAVSEYVRQSAHRRLHIPLGKIDVVYNPVDFCLFSESTAERRNQIRRELEFDESQLLMLYVARLDPPKGHRPLIRALPRVFSKHPEAHLLLVGGGDRRYEDELRRLTNSIGVSEKVHFLGIRRDVSNLLGACDLFIFPSLYEGLPIALLEALAMKRACVASRIGPISEIIQDGVSGMLVEPGNDEELAAAISRLLSDHALRARMGSNGRAKTEARFDIRMNIRRLEAVYEKTLEEWRSSRYA